MTEYAPGRALDLYGDAAGPTVLLWHGMQSNARASVRHLAEALAAHALDVVVPDWDSHSPDGGRSDLLQSANFARSRGTDVVIVGWSMGGAAAADLTLHAQRFDVPIAHTVCLAGAFTARGPITGTPPIEAAASARTGTPFTLLHGVADDVVPSDVSRDFAAVLRRVEWPVEATELDADHGTIAGARYDAAADRYAPDASEASLAVVVEVAAIVATTAGR